MRYIVKRLTMAFTAILCLSAGFATEVYAEPNVVQVKPSHYRGTWLEIGRRPMWLTDGCVAGYTTYRSDPRANEISVEDGCHEGTPTGKLKSVKGRGTLLDAGTTNAKLRVRYPLLVKFTYCVLYKSPDDSWFISADPDMKNLWIYARTVPTRSKLASMIKKAKSLGYDVRKLEFPAQ